MFNNAKNLLILSLALSFTSCSGHKANQASQATMSLPGALKIIEFKPRDYKKNQLTFWKSTDGVNPDIAGCHLGTDKNGIANGRMFGEACLLNGYLVESITEIGKMHSHENDTGQLVTFDCKQWCLEQGLGDGKCMITPAPPCRSSAKCICE